jgi:uncharacterized protein YecE (DUF72 family)
LIERPNAHRCAIYDFRVKNVRLWVGTSGYSYKEWLGKFYPERFPAKEMLRFYASRFAAVEINNTFYRLPKETLLQSWAEQVPPEFLFVLKAPRRITHIKRLKDSGPEIEYLVRVATALGSSAGAVLFQLPPNLKKDLERLQTFLSLLPVIVMWRLNSAISPGSTKTSLPACECATARCV